MRAAHRQYQEELRLWREANPVLAEAEDKEYEELEREAQEREQIMMENPQSPWWSPPRRDEEKLDSLVRYAPRSRRGMGRGRSRGRGRGRARKRALTKRKKKSTRGRSRPRR